MQIDEQKIVQFRYVPPEVTFPFQLDLLLAGQGHQQAALARSVAQEIPGLGHAVQVLRPDDLIILKLSAGRIIDRAAVAMLLREDRDEIDINYSTSVIGKLTPPHMKTLGEPIGLITLCQHAQNIRPAA